MSLRLPQNLEPALSSDRAMDAFHQEILAETAASLGRSGKTLVARLGSLQRDHADGDRETLLHEAARAAHGYFIQRELCGLFDHRAVIEEYDIPREVMARVGVYRRVEGDASS